MSSTSGMGGGFSAGFVHGSVLHPSLGPSRMLGWMGPRRGLLGRGQATLGRVGPYVLESSTLPGPRPCAQAQIEFSEHTCLVPYGALITGEATVKEPQCLPTRSSRLGLGSSASTLPTS